MNTSVIAVSQYLTPHGSLLLGEHNNKLCLCDWINRKNRVQIDMKITRFLCAKYEERESELLSRTISLFNQYFEGEKIELNIPLLFIGTPFQKKIWNGH